MIQNASIEAQLIGKHFPQTTQRHQKEVTPQQLTTDLRQNHQIFNFIGHGAYNFSNPLASALYLHQEKKYTLQDIIQLDLRTYELICLSSCETGVTGNQSILAEYIGLTSAFIKANARNIISTLWTVEAEATFLLIVEFYERWLNGEPMPLALQNAQQWLSHATPAQLITWYENHQEDNFEIEQYFESRIDKLENLTTPPYQHPYYWAAFTLTGNSPR